MTIDNDDTPRVKPQPWDAIDTTNKLLNSWLQTTAGIPITLQLTKLGFRIIEALEAAYKAGQNSIQSTSRTEKE